MTLYVFLGNSGAGKDTAASVIGGVNVKWSSLMKRTFEQWYGLPTNSFDNRQFRTTYTLPNGKTPLQVMVDAYEAWDKIDEGLTARPIARDVIAYYNNGGHKDTCFTDTRKLIEADLICDVAKQTGLPVHVVYIHAQARALPTDKYAKEIQDRLLLGCSDVQYTLLFNNFDEEFKLDVAALD